MSYRNKKKRCSCSLDWYTVVIYRSLRAQLILGSYGKLELDPKPHMTLLATAAMQMQSLRQTQIQ